jgi:hypothetical protein
MRSHSESVSESESESEVSASSGGAGIASWLGSWVSGRTGLSTPV